MTSVCVITAMIFRRPPQPGHASTSAAKTRCYSSEPWTMDRPLGVTDQGDVASSPLDSVMPKGAAGSSTKNW